MKPLLKVSNNELSYRLNLNYNNVYSRLRMKLGSKASLFADISTKSTGVTWYSDDDADYSPLSEAPKDEVNKLVVALNDVISAVRKELKETQELADYVDDILEIPGNDFVFYRRSGNGYKFILTGWGCKYAHQSASDPNSGFIKRLSKKLEVPDVPVEKPANKDLGSILHDLEEPTPSPTPNVGQSESAFTKSSETVKPVGTNTEDSVVSEEKNQEVKPQEPVSKKTQHVIVRLLDQNNNPVNGEEVAVHASTGEAIKITSEKGLIDVGNLPYGDSFSITFPNMGGTQERSFEVEPNVEIYDAFIKKYKKYTPVLFVEDQNGNSVQDYNVKVLIKGQEMVYNSGQDGVIQLPTMLEGQKFVVIDTANYANTEEYNITQAEAKTPYHFHVRSAEKSKVGITVLDVSGKPIPKTNVSLKIGDTPCQQITDDKGRAEFPADIFVAGNIPVNLSIKGQGLVKSDMKYQPEVSEYTIRLRDKKPGFDWRWLGLLPLLLLLGWGGYTLYGKLLSHKTPTIAEMETGVCLILGQGYYYVDLKVSDIQIDGHPAVAYFNYDENERIISNLTFDPEKAKVQGWWGTGFLISDDGLIATNRHVASPIPPQEAAQVLKKSLQETKDSYQQKVDKLNDKLQILGGLSLLNQEYADTRKELIKCQEQVRIFDKLINTGEFVVEMKCVTSVAFTNSQIENEDDFIACSQPKAVGDPGSVTEKDLAIIQIKKKQDIPTDAFVFAVPEKDLMDEDIPDNYEITVIGYNAGGSIQDMKLQDGLRPQAQHGKINVTSPQKYRISYDAPTIGGSSGSPVINSEGQLIAINNSNVRNAQGLAYGVRTKYLKELLDDLKKKNKSDN